MKLNTLYLLLAVAFIVLVRCSLQDPFGDEKDSKLTGNMPPETHLFLYVDQQQIAYFDTVRIGDTTKVRIDTSYYTTGLDTTPSKQIVHWWGDDPDGQVIGYYYQWDYESEPTFTTDEYDTFYVPIRSEYDEFTIRVWAVDNDSLSDPSAAVLCYPVYNSPPEILFRLGSNPLVVNNPDVTAFTFPTRTFSWEAYDPDGKETITNIWYALDDTSSWIALPGDETQLTLRDDVLTPGEHKIFIRAQDVSGRYSNLITFPDPDDDQVPNRWVVKPIQGDILLVNDYAQDQNLHEIQNFYTQILDAIDRVGENGYSVWEIGTDRTPVVNPQNALPASSIDIEANLSYFKKVIWFSFRGRPGLLDASLSITKFISNGGKIFISNGNNLLPDTTWTFTNIDTVKILNPTGRLFVDTEINAFFGSNDDSALDLKLGELIADRVYSLIPGIGATPVFKMQNDTTATVKVPYTGEPVVGLRYRVGEGESIYFSLPFHSCYGNDNMKEFFEYILFEEFEN